MRVETTASAEQTEELGAAIAERLGPGDVVLVRGDLGSGKTTLIRGAAEALGVTEPVTSPTFTIAQRYAGPVPVAHLDLYRLGEAGLAAEDPALLADYLTDESVAFVEWPDAAEPQLGHVALSIEIRHAGGDRREVRISELPDPGRA